MKTSRNKMSLRWLFAVLAVLTVAFASAGVVSADSVQDTQSFFDSATVNETGDVIRESSYVVFTPYNAPADNSFTTLEEAAAYLRAQMVDRKIDVTVTVTGSQSSEINYSELFLAAVAHTGFPVEGDYIYKHCGGYSVTTETGFDGVDDYRTFTFDFIWYTTREQEDEIDTAVASLLAELNLGSADEYTKVRTLYDYICDNMRYDYDGLEAGNSKLIYTAYAAMINKTAVCQGFASLYYRLCLEVGVDCRVVTGYSEDERHAWNITRLGDVYYNMDTTWDLGISVYYRYFLCTKNNFVNHTRDDEFNTAEFNAEYPMADVPYGIVAEASGRLTSGHSWYLDKNGTLTVEGNGAMTNFGNLGAPWYPYAESIRKIVLSEGVTTVGSYAFVRCKNATEVVWPSTLRDIHTYAFDNCRSLKTLELPYGVKSLGRCSFSECMALTRVELPDSITYCDGSTFSLDHNITYIKLSAGMSEIPDSMFFAMNGLKTVIIPNGITRIGDTAFRRCGGITSITIPAQISYIGTAAFSDCVKLQNIYVDSANQHFTSVNGVLYSKDMKTLACYPGGKYGSYNIPEGVTTLAYGSFGSSGVTSVTFPSTLQVIDTYSFAWCKYLSSAKIPASVTTVGDTAFGWCTNLRSVTFANPNTTLDWHVFDGCTSLTSITLPSNLKELNTGLFDDCSALTSITIPNSVTRIGDSAFSGCTGLKKLTLHENIHYIGYDAFWECKNLERLTVKGNIYEIDFRAFKGCTSLSVIRFCGTLSGVDSTAFSDITLKAVYFDSQTAVNGISGSGAFGGLLSNAKSIGVAQSVTTIPSYVKNNFTYKSAFSYEGQSYYLYSDHNCSWYSNKCYYCKAIRDYELCVHNYDSLVIAPTCIDWGYTYYWCNSCGNVYEDNFVDPTGHDYSYVITPPTCYSWGYTEYTCMNCGDRYESDYTSPVDHEYIAVTTPPTCTEQGYTAYTCDMCGDSYADSYVEATGHSFGSWTTTKASTCTATGTERRDCVNCDHYETRTVNALGHTEVTDNAVEPTCTETGLTEGKHCSTCGEILVAQQTIPAKGHSFGDWTTTKAPTCTESGTERRDCANCDHYETRTVNALGHTEVTDNAVEATCTASGLTEGKHCSVCGEVLVPQQTVPAKGHSFGSWTTTKAPTCTATGTERRDCANCDHYETRTVNALGHTEVLDAAVEPTCTASGLTEGKHCSICGVILVPQQTIAAKGHSFGKWIVTTAPTCTSTGTERRDCANCDHYETRTVNALGHTEVIDKAVAATCTETGLTEGKHCSVCGEVLVPQQTVPANGHSFGDWVVTKPATEDSKGIKERICSACSLKETASVPKLDHVHDYDSVVTDPTCTEQGFTTHTCRCGDSYVDSCVPAKGHSFGKWIVTTAPTCTATGTERRDCANCDHYETRTVNALGHTEVLDAAVEPTCTASGLTEGKHCSVCGGVLVPQQTVPANGHSFGDWVVTKPATEDSEGLKERTCSACSLKETASVPKLDHVHKYDAVVTDPTCTEQGFTTHTCRCGDSYVDSYVPAKGHSFGSWTTTKAPTCTATGTERRDCANCDHYETRTVNALGHTEVTDNAVEATCTASGLTEGKHCSVCGEVLVPQQTIAANGHSFGDWVVTKPATEDTEGVKERICSACSLKETASVPKLDHVHKYDAVVTDPTCTEQGFTTHTCRCGDSYVDTYTPAKGHSFGNWTTTKAPTCTATGTERRDCANCDHYETRTVNALGHTEVTDNAVEATCTASGLTEGKHCSVCGEILVPQQTVPANGHSFGSWTTTTAPTCTATGTERRDCANCDHYETRTLPALGHTEVIDKAVAATCTTSGLTEGKHCSVCGEVLVAQQTIPALGHDFADEWTVDVEPTAEREGQKSRHCTRCDEVTDIIVIAKLVEIIDTSKKFIDVVESWSKPGIDYVVSYGYMNGTGNGTTFSPSDTMTRAMIVSVLHRIAGKPAPSVKNPFKDLEAGQTWYHDAVIWAYENGIVTGTSATTFAPTGAVTREQMATFLYRFAKFMGYDTTASADLSKFPDEGKVGSWAYDALAWANAEGLITGAKGYDGITRLDPQGAATREQVATILMRFCKAMEA